MQMFITAAPVGAVPKHLNVHEPKFIPAALLDACNSQTQRIETIDLLKSSGWEEVDPGGVGISSSYSLGKDGKVSVAPPLPLSILETLTSTKAVREILLCLTTQGWVVNDNDTLCWPHGDIETYLSPDMVVSEGEVLVAELISRGWILQDAGLWNPCRASSPYLPITPAAIIDESLAAVNEGAAIIHLHTREQSVKRSITLPKLHTPIQIEKQSNLIDETQYDVIVPRLQSSAPAAILNLSTSVRGGKENFESPLRRAHLKPYGLQGTTPDMASFSPGAVMFQSGGGYDNPPNFLDAQLKHCAHYSVRPEIEVFNGQILNNALNGYQARLNSCGQPIVFMLVAAVDQYKHTPEGNVDDSLIPVEERKSISRLVRIGTKESLAEAVAVTVASLKPVVERIRSQSPAAKISALMPGPMQIILAKVAVELGLDGVRVGLEDALNVPDERISGGVRKGTTAEQVRLIRYELEAAGVRILTADETRDALDMPRREVALFREAASALEPLMQSIATPSPRKLAADVTEALACVSADYSSLERAFIAEIHKQQSSLPKEPTVVADYAVSAIQQHGLYARYFVEERDRYPAIGAKSFKQVYRLQALNFTRELYHDFGYTTVTWDETLKRLALESGLPADAYLVPPQQFKGKTLRLLEFLTSIPCRYNQERNQVFNTSLRKDMRYSETMAVLFEAINELTLSLRERSDSEPKLNGIWVYRTKEKKKAKGKKHTTAPCQEELGHMEVRSAINDGAWIVLPSTPTTNYPEGMKLSKGLTSTFSSFLSDVVDVEQKCVDVLGSVHSGIDLDGRPLVESSMLHNRFSLNTGSHESLVAHSPRMIYERLLLPRIVEHPLLLQRTDTGLVARDKRGWPINHDGSLTKRISFQKINELNTVRFLAHSSGIATIQQMDNAMRRDMNTLGYSVQEQEEIFNRGIVISLASACDVNVDTLGTPVVDITAYNDVRSMAGTTTDDYLLSTAEDRQVIMQHQRSAKISSDYQYSHAKWILRKGAKKKVLLRLANVYLREDPLRQHDGHSIRRYLEGSPPFVKELFSIIHHAPQTVRMDILLRQYFAKFPD